VQLEDWTSVAILIGVITIVGVLSRHMHRRFDVVDQRFVSVTQRFGATDQRFDAIDRRFETVDHRFDALDHKVDTRIDSPADMNGRSDEANTRLTTLEQRTYDIAHPRPTGPESGIALVGAAS
jgi:hypothetical protein